MKCEKTVVSEILRCLQVFEVSSHLDILGGSALIIALSLFSLSIHEVQIGTELHQSL